MTGFRSCSFLTHDLAKPWDAEAGMQKNLRKIEEILYAEGRQGRFQNTVFSLPDGTEQTLSAGYEDLPWGDGKYRVTAHPERIELEVPVMTAGVEELVQHWENLLGIPAEPVCTRIQMTEAEKAVPAVLPELSIPLEWEREFPRRTVRRPGEEPKQVSFREAVRRLEAERGWNVQICDNHMRLTRRERNYILSLFFRLCSCDRMDQRDFPEPDMPVCGCEVCLNIVGSAWILYTQYTRHTDQQGLEAFLAYTLDCAGDVWEKLQKEKITAPDYPDWYI